MRLELNSIKESLLNSGQSIINETHLIDDMTEMIKYYQEVPEDIPDGIKDYFEGNNAFNPKEFAVRYIGNLIDKKLSYSSDDNGFITLNII